MVASQLGREPFAAGAIAQRAVARYVRVTFEGRCCADRQARRCASCTSRIRRLRRGAPRRAVGTAMRPSARRTRAPPPRALAIGGRGYHLCIMDLDGVGSCYHVDHFKQPPPRGGAGSLRNATLGCVTAVVALLVVAPDAPAATSCDRWVAGSDHVIRGDLSRSRRLEQPLSHPRDSFEPQPGGCRHGNPPA